MPTLEWGRYHVQLTKFCKENCPEEVRSYNLVTEKLNFVDESLAEIASLKKEPIFKDFPIRRIDTRKNHVFSTKTQL